ncbi:hypothetical protein DI17_003541 [Escherichia coli]|nr:hypothetical protein [Escherichia coli]
MELIKCAFCGRNQGEVALMIQRTKVAICSDCVSACMNIVNRNKFVAAPVLGIDGQKEKDEITTTVRGVDVQKNGAHYGEETVVKAPPYRLSEKNVYEMWTRVKKQAEDALQFLFVTSEVEAHKDNDPLSKWIVVVYEDQVCFERFGDGITLEGYAPVPPAKAAVYAAAIVNGLEPPKYLRPCDKPTD